jgi:poly(hydroxyalkanoate) depolymerase family esterase
MRSAMRWGLLWAGLLAGAAQAQSLTAVTGFGSNPGALTMFKYVPAGLPANAPLVVALHGCAQSASNYDAETGWVLLADRWKFALLLPEQTTSNNSSRCFNWFEAGDIARGAGEALSIKQAVDKLKADHASDPARVYVTGLSAGAAMTAVMLATYPEVFAGGAIIAGVPYNCGTGLTNAFSCMNPGSDLTPAQWGNKVRAASSHSGPWPLVSIWHGDADTTVRPANANELVEQWTNVHGVDQTADVQDTIGGYPHKVYRNAAGTAVVESWSITGMGHGTPVDPGSGERQCGTAGAYILDVNLCSSWYIGKYFGLDNTDSTPPVASITAPANGAGVSGMVTISAAASDNVGVARVEFLIDGALVASDTSSPYTHAWDSASGPNGTRTLSARAVDAAGNVGTSAPVSVTVSGGIEDTTPPSVNLTFPANGATVSGTVQLTASASDDTGVASVEFFLDGASLGVGNQSAQAGPWTLDWNTTAASAGSHALSVVARDARGNQTLDNDTSVTVNQVVLAVDESFSNRNADGDYTDQTGWSGDFIADADNATAGAGPSQSAYGYASSGVSCASGWKTKFLQRSAVLGSAPRLSYSRKLDLKAAINSTTAARFRVLVNGAVFHEKAVTNANYADSAWQRFDNLDLTAYAGQTVTLRFEAAANSECLHRGLGQGARRRRPRRQRQRTHRRNRPHGQPDRTGERRHAQRQCRPQRQRQRRGGRGQGGVPRQWQPDRRGPGGAVHTDLEHRGCGQRQLRADGQGFRCSRQCCQRCRHHGDRLEWRRRRRAGDRQLCLRGRQRRLPQGERQWQQPGARHPGVLAGSGYRPRHRCQVQPRAVVLRHQFHPRHRHHHRRYVDRQLQQRLGRPLGQPGRQHAGDRPENRLLRCLHPGDRRLGRRREQQRGSEHRALHRGHAVLVRIQRRRPGRDQQDRAHPGPPALQPEPDRG